MRRFGGGWEPRSPSPGGRERLTPYRCCTTLDLTSTMIGSRALYDCGRRDLNPKSRGLDEPTSHHDPGHLRRGRPGDGRLGRILRSQSCRPIARRDRNFRPAANDDFGSGPFCSDVRCTPCRLDLVAPQGEDGRLPRRDRIGRRRHFVRRHHIRLREDPGDPPRLRCSCGRGGEGSGAPGNRIRGHERSGRDQGTSVALSRRRRRRCAARTRVGRISRTSAGSGSGPRPWPPVRSGSPWTAAGRTQRRPGASRRASARACGRWTQAGARAAPAPSAD